MQALDNVTVLDFTHHIAGPYATKLMADYGADVIKIERPGGDIARRLGPYRDNVPHIERSGLFFMLNTNKRSVVLDLATPEAKDAVAALAAKADLVIDNFAPGVMDRLGLGYDFFQAIKPELPVISVTNFGQTGPYRDYRLTELVLYGFAGEMYTMGITEREPVKLAGTAALFESGSSIATAAMGTLFASKRFGIGQHADIALAETHFGGVDRRHATAIAYQFSGRKSMRAAGGNAGMPSGIYPASDGYVEFNNAMLYPDRVADMLGYPDWNQDPRFQDPTARANPELVEEWNANFIVWCIERTKREIWAEARRAKLLCAPLFTTEDLYEDEHFRDRGFWAKASHAELGEIEFPGRPFILEKGGWELRRPAPLLGEHTDEVLTAAGLSPAQIAAAQGGNV